MPIIHATKKTVLLAGFAAVVVAALGTSRATAMPREVDTLSADSWEMVMQNPTQDPLPTGNKKREGRRPEHGDRFKRDPVKVTLVPEPLSPFRP